MLRKHLCVKLCMSFGDKLFYFASGILIAFSDSRQQRSSEVERQSMQRDWYVVYSKPYKEEQVQLHLGLKGIESFFPRLEMPASINRGRTITPLFPNYLFARIALATEAHYVIWSPGVKRIVSFSDTPVPLEENIIAFLRERADERGVIRAQSQLSAGQQVEITGGPFDGFVGIIENPPNAKGRVKILLKLLSRQISVRLGVEFIRNPSVAPILNKGDAQPPRGMAFGS